MGETLAPTKPEPSVLLDPDTYILEIENITKHDSTVIDDKTGEEKPSAYYRWQFIIVDEKAPEGARGTTLRGNTSTLTGPKSKMFEWVSAALGEPWVQPIDFPDDLIGKRVKAFVGLGSYKDQAGNQVATNKVEKLMPVKGFNQTPRPANGMGTPSSNGGGDTVSVINQIGEIVGRLGWDKKTAKTNRLEVIPRDVPISNLTLDELNQVRQAFAETLALKNAEVGDTDPDDIPF